MKRILISVFFVLTGLLIQAQDDNGMESFCGIQWEVDSIESFSNKEFLNDVFRGKSIISLGELDHGDGTSFLIKTELIKYLHEEMGFNTLAFESSFVNADFLWRQVGGESPTQEIAKDYIFYIWSEVEEMKSLYDYIDEQKAKGTPLELVGIDPQFSGNKSVDDFLSLILDNLLFQRAVVMEDPNFEKFKTELNTLSQWFKFPEEKDHVMSEEEFRDYLEYLKSLVMKNGKGDLKERFQKYFENVLLMSEIKWEIRKDAFEKRDKQMFDNLLYHKNKASNGKIILWAANAHLSRRDGEFEEKGKHHMMVGLKKLGDHIYENLKEESYTIAVVSSKGKTLNFHNKRLNKLNKPAKESIEKLLKDSSNGFYDLKDLERRFGLEKYLSSMFYTNVSCNAKWSDHYDGIFYIHEMLPSTPMW